MKTIPRYTTSIVSPMGRAVGSLDYDWLLVPEQTLLSGTPDPRTLRSSHPDSKIKSKAHITWYLYVGVVFIKFSNYGGGFLILAKSCRSSRVSVLSAWVRQKALLTAYQLGEGMHWYLVLFFMLYKQLNFVLFFMLYKQLNLVKKKKKFSSPVFSLKTSCFLPGSSF